MRIDSERLSRLGSMKELKAAKRQVNREIRRIERRFKGEFCAAKQQFSLKTAIMYGVEVVDTVQSVLRHAKQGFGTKRRCSGED